MLALTAEDALRCCTLVLVQGSCKCCNTIFLFFSLMVLICQHARSSHRLGKLLTEAINISAMGSLNWGNQCNAYNITDLQLVHAHDSIRLEASYIITFMRHPWLSRELSMDIFCR